MRTLLRILTILFVVLTFAGAGYVIASSGKANAGYAVIPMAAALACFSGQRAYNNNSGKTDA